MLRLTAVVTRRGVGNRPLSSRPLSSWDWSSPKKDDAILPNVPPPPSPGRQIDPAIQDLVTKTCARLHKSAMPLNSSLRGPLETNSDKTTALPFVFLVGNHSSGKSSFINYVLGRRIQTAGVAPTDDCFTVIAPGAHDIDQDGPALIGDPDMGE